MKGTASRCCQTTSRATWPSWRARFKRSSTKGQDARDAAPSSIDDEVRLLFDLHGETEEVEQARESAGEKVGTFLAKECGGSFP